jgi:hypothetical protein
MYERGTQPLPDSACSSEQHPASADRGSEQTSAARERLHSALGQIVLALSTVPSYRHSTLAELQHGLAGIASWASVKAKAVVHV